MVELTIRKTVWVNNIIRYLKFHTSRLQVTHMPQKFMSTIDIKQQNSRKNGIYILMKQLGVIIKFIILL